jgi:hypothetical protein
MARSGPVDLPCVKARRLGMPRADSSAGVRSGQAAGEGKNFAFLRDERPYSFPQKHSLVEPPELGRLSVS